MEGAFRLLHDLSVFHVAGYGPIMVAHANFSYNEPHDTKLLHASNYNTLELFLYKKNIHFATR